HPPRRVGCRLSGHAHPPPARVSWPRRAARTIFAVHTPAIETFGIRSVAFHPGAESPSQSRLEMIIKQSRWLAVIAPVAIVTVLEVVRTSVLGFVSLRDRLVLDVIVAG